MGDGTHLHPILAWIHLEMILLLICLASGLASSEKLDRSYLPPPGSKFSGGTPGDIQVPLEFPKETYTTVKPQGRPGIELGINRRLPSPSGIPESQKPGSLYSQNSYVVPKTTTSYAITQTTTFAPAEDYEGLEQSTGFTNGSSGIQTGFPGQSYQRQPIRVPGERPSFNQYQPGGQPSTIAPYGTAARPLFPGLKKGLEYLPPVPSSNNRGQSPGELASDQDGLGYQQQRPKYQDGQLIPGQTLNQPSLTQGSNQKTEYTASQNIPSSVAPQFQNGRFGSTGPASQQTQNQFQGSQFTSSTAAPQYQAGQSLNTPGYNQYNQFSSSQDLPSSTTAPRFQPGQRFTTPGLNQPVLGAKGPSQQNQYNGNQYQGNQNFPLSTTSPTLGPIRQSFSEEEIQGGFLPGQQDQNRYIVNQNFPSSTTAPQFQDGERFPSPSYVQQGMGSRVTPVQNLKQYPGNQIFPSSTVAPQYQNGQQFNRPESIRQNQYPGNQNYQSTVSPNYQDGQRFSTPSQFVPSQQSFGSRIPNQQNQNQHVGNENFPTTASPQYQDSQRFIIPGSQITNQPSQNQYPVNQNFPSSTAPQDSQRFTTPGSEIPNQQSQNQYSLNQNYPSSTAAPAYQDGQGFTIPGSQIPNQQNRNQYNKNQNLPSSTTAPQYQDGQRFTTPASQQRFESQQYQSPGSPSSTSTTAAPQFQDQRFSTPGQLGLPKQPVNYPGSITGTQFQQTLVPTPGSNLPGFVPQNQYQQGIFLPGSQSYGNIGTQTTPGTTVSFPASQGSLIGTQPSIYGNTQQSTSQTGEGSFIYGTTPSLPSSINQSFASTTVGPQPSRDFSPSPAFSNIVQTRPERPQAESDRNAEILSYENILTPEGYSYSYDTSNGIHADETGTVGNGTRAQGGFSYTGDDGKVYSVFYSADENGFQPQGDHLPTSPPIPEAIQRVIDQAIKDKESGIEDDGSYNEEKYGFMKYEGPYTRLRPRNRTMSSANRADLQGFNQNRYGDQKNKVLKSKGSKLSSVRYPEVDGNEEFESEPGNESEENVTNEKERDGGDGSDSNTGNVERISANRPKPNKNLTVEDGRPNRLRGNKMKSNINPKFDSTQTNKPFNSSGRRPVASEEEENVGNDDISTTDTTDDQKNSDGSVNEEPQEFDYESDLINYKDDSNNRTNFHGLNKYLPKPKGNQKNQSGKKRPTEIIYDTQAPAVIKYNEPGNDYYEVSQEDKYELNDGTRTRIPSKKNKMGQKIKDQSRVVETPASFDSNVEVNMYGDGSVDTEDNGSDEGTRPSINRMGKPGVLQSKNKTGNTIRLIMNERTSVLENKNNKPSSSDETGYEYTPPDRTFETGSEFTSRITVSGKPTLTLNGSRTTLRPFMTKNVYGDDNESADEDIDQYGAVKPDRRGRPMAGQNQQYPGLKQDGERYNVNINPDINENERFSTTRKPEYGSTSRRPFGRPQTTAAPQYEGQSVTDQEIYKRPVNTQQSQRPGSGGNVFYNNIAPNRATSVNVFSSSTPLPPSRPGGQYQSRPTDAPAFYDETSSTGPTYINRPGANEPVSAQFPSTTYRPNYSFGDRTLGSSSPVNVDGFGRPISSTNAPAFDRTIRPIYSTVRPSTEGSMEDKFKNTEGRFGAPAKGPPGYQSSTSAPSEDFSGPKQPQRFDPESGYYYK